jgi:hypothetical protein
MRTPDDLRRALRLLKYIDTTSDYDLRIRMFCQAIDLLDGHAMDIPGDTPTDLIARIKFRYTRKLLRQLVGWRTTDLVTQLDFLEMLKTKVPHEVRLVMQDNPKLNEFYEQFGQEVATITGSYLGI